MNTGVTRYVKAPFRSALRGKCTQRKSWIGASSDDVRSLVVLLAGPEKLRRFFTAKNRLPAPGSFDSMPKPTKSRGGRPFRQFMASSAMPSPRCTVRVNGAAALLPETWKSSLMGGGYGCMQITRSKRRGSRSVSHGPEVRWRRQHEVMAREVQSSRTAFSWTAVAILVALVTAASAAGAASRPTAAPFTYVALGDSYSAGEGVGPYLPNACHRSSRAYTTWVNRPAAARSLYATASGGGRPGILGGKNKYGSERNVRSAAGVTWASWACSGAKTKNVLPMSLGGVPQQGLGRIYDGATQLDSAKLARADLVTLTIGGNDAGFVDVLLLCALGTCNTQAFERAREAIIDDARPLLEQVYRAVARKAPRARILVLGYPGLFPATKAEQSCAGLSPFRGEQNMLRRLGSHLNETIEAAVEAVGRSGAKIEFVSVTSGFAGHEICGRKGPWLNGVVTSKTGLGLDAGSFHPNLRGQRDGYAAAVDAAVARER